MKSENQLEILINDIVAIHTQARMQVIRLVNGVVNEKPKLFFYF